MTPAVRESKPSHGPVTCISSPSIVTLISSLLVLQMDTAPHVEVRVTQRFSAAPDRVFDAWLDPRMAGKWLFATAWRPMSGVTIDARVGGSFHFEERRDGMCVIQAGRYVEIARPRRLVFTLSSEKRPQGIRVRVAIVPLETGCEISVVQESVLPGDAISTEGRWSGMLYGLAALLGQPGG